MLRRIFNILILFTAATIAFAWTANVGVQANIDVEQWHYPKDYWRPWGGAFHVSHDWGVTIHPIVTRDANGVLQFDWTHLDNQIEAIKSSVHQEPIMVLAYMPLCMLADPEKVVDGYPTLGAGPPSDWQEWEYICYEVVYHCNIVKDYDLKYWEVWNEPDQSWAWKGTTADYYTLYERAIAGAKSADPTIFIGGPAASQNNVSYVDNFINHCGSNNLDLDWLTWHSYDPNIDLYFTLTDHFTATLADNGYPPATEMWLTEWGNGSDSSIHDWIWRGSAVLNMINSGIDGMWDGIQETPAAVVKELFMMMGPIEIQSSDDYANTRVLASRTADGLTFTVMIANISPDPETVPNGTVNLEITGLPFDGSQDVSYERYLYDSNHTDPTPTLVASGTINPADTFSESLTLSLDSMCLVKLALQGIGNYPKADFGSETGEGSEHRDYVVDLYDLEILCKHWMESSLHE